MIENDLVDNIYILLKEKCESKIYKNMKNGLKDDFIEGEDIFKKLNLNEKAYIIREALNLLGTNSIKPNFEKIGKKSSSRMTISSNIENKKIYVYNESVTGVFENKIRIK